MVNIYDRRHDLARLLHRQLPSSFLVVSAPDHPLLIRAPDIIASTEQSIVALFTPSATERRSQSLFKSRFVLSRLALPPHARFLLVFEPFDESIARDFARDFAEVIPWSDRAGIVSIVQDRNFVGHHRDVPSEVAVDAQTRFANAMAVMRLTARLSRRPFTTAFGEEPYLEIPEAGNAPAIRRRPIKPRITRDTSSIGLEGVAFSEISDNQLDAAIVRELVNEQAAYAFSLDNGIPYARDHATGIAVINDWPTKSRDPDKLIHAAAFAGWAFILQENRNELSRFARRLRYRQQLA